MTGVQPPRAAEGTLPDLPSPAQCRHMADFLQGFVNPVRLEIICTLRDGEKTAGDIVRRMGAKKSNVSRQLGILVAKGCVTRRREAQNVYYAVGDTDVYEVMGLILHLVCGSDGAETGGGEESPLRPAAKQIDEQ